MRVDGAYNALDVYYFESGGYMVITPISVRWSGDVKQSARKAVITIANTADGLKRLLTYKNGRTIVIKEDGAEIFRGTVFSCDYDSNGNVNLTVYDPLTYLARNEDTRIFRNMKASAIARQLCDNFGVKVGSIADTGYVIPKLILRNKTIWDMIITALTVTKEQTGKRFFVYGAGGKLNLVERKTQTVRWVIEKKANLLTAHRIVSIEDIATQVKITGTTKDDTEISVTTRNASAVSEFGLIQNIEDIGYDATQSSITQRANTLLKDKAKQKEDMDVSALGISEVISGRAIYAYDELSGIYGGCYVQSDEHTFENGKHTMNLRLSWTDELPTIKYEPPKE